MNGPRVGVERGLLDGSAEAADQVAGEVLERAQRRAAAVVGRRRPAALGPQPGQGVLELVVGGVRQVPLADGRPDRGVVHRGELEPAGHDAVLDVVHGVRHVVGEVHDLRLEALAARRATRRGASRRPAGRRRTPRTSPTCRPGVAGPRVLAAGVQRGPGQVEADRAAVRVDGLGLEPGEEPQGLGVALEASARLAELGEGPLAVVAERRVAEVVRQRGRLGDVGLAAEGARQVAGDLGDLEAVGQPVADEVVGLRADHLGLGRQAPERRSVDDPRPVALERRPFGGLDPLGRLCDEPLTRVRVVQAVVVHRGSL